MSLIELMMWSPIIIIAGLIGIVLGSAGILLAIMFVLWFFGTTLELLVMFAKFLLRIFKIETDFEEYDCDCDEKGDINED